jgi:hypothetical protein
MSRRLLDRRMKTLASTVAYFAFALAAGCAGVERPTAPPTTAIAVPEAVAPVAAVTPPAVAPAAPPAIAAEDNSAPTTPTGAAHADGASARAQPAATASSAQTAATPASAPAPSTASNAGANAKTAVKATAPAPHVTAAAPPQPAKAASAPAVTAAKPAAAPPLDLKSLEARLRETSAVGVMTKLTLKNQVDDLLDQFREFYQGKLKTTLAQLRQSYDRLVMKVLALLQDADPPLANAIASSREAIWGILADPVKFAAV